MDSNAEQYRPCDPGTFGTNVRSLNRCVKCHTDRCAKQVRREHVEFYAGVTCSHAIKTCPQCVAALYAAWERDPEYVDPGTPGPPAEAVHDPTTALRDPFTE